MLHKPKLKKKQLKIYEGLLLQIKPFTIHSVCHIRGVASVKAAFSWCCCAACVCEGACRRHSASCSRCDALMFVAKCLFVQCVSRVLPVFILQSDKRDTQGNGCITGFEVLLQKQLKGKQMQKEMAEFIRERYQRFSSAISPYLFFHTSSLVTMKTIQLSLKQTISSFFFLLIHVHHCVAQRRKTHMETVRLRKGCVVMKLSTSLSG